jgi:hypothetical protein
MGISNPEAVRFVNEQVRPLCEKVRALVFEILAAQTTWYGGLNASFPNDATLLDDGREADGSSRLTGAQINSAMGVLISMAGASNSEIIAKPCVRALSAQ